MKNPLLEALIGCRIKTHYGTGGIVTSYCGPHDAYGAGSWSIYYRHDGDKTPKYNINSIKIENGVIACEGRPLTIMRQEDDAQESLF